MRFTLTNERYALSEIDTAGIVLKGKLARNFAFEENTGPSVEHIRQEFSRKYSGGELLAINPHGTWVTARTLVVTVLYKSPPFEETLARLEESLSRPHRDVCRL